MEEGWMCMQNGIFIDRKRTHCTGTNETCYLRNGSQQRQEIKRRGQYRSYRWQIEWGHRRKNRNVDDNNMVLELSKSPTNAGDFSNKNMKDNNPKSKERDDTDGTENKNKDGAREIITSAMATLEDTESEREYEAVHNIGNNNTKKGLFTRKIKFGKKKRE